MYRPMIELVWTQISRELQVLRCKFDVLRLGVEYTTGYERLTDVLHIGGDG